jgi:hypothetical protein
MPPRTYEVEVGGQTYLVEEQDLPAFIAEANGRPIIVEGQAPPTSEAIQETVPAKDGPTFPVSMEELKWIGVVVAIGVIGAYLLTWSIGLFIGLSYHHTRKVLKWCGYK